VIPVRGVISPPGGILIASHWCEHSRRTTRLKDELTFVGGGLVLGRLGSRVSCVHEHVRFFGFVSTDCFVSLFSSRRFSSLFLCCISSPSLCNLHSGFSFLFSFEILFLVSVSVFRLLGICFSGFFGFLFFLLFVSFLPLLGVLVSLLFFWLCDLCSLVVFSFCVSFLPSFVAESSFLLSSFFFSSCPS